MIRTPPGSTAVFLDCEWNDFRGSLISIALVAVETPPLTFEIVRIDAGSAVPHNALWDARGLRDALLPSEQGVCDA